MVKRIGQITVAGLTCAERLARLAMPLRGVDQARIDAPRRSWS
jgi:hypothetical protein